MRMDANNVTVFKFGHNFKLVAQQALNIASELGRDLKSLLKKGKEK